MALVRRLTQRGPLDGAINALTFVFCFVVKHAESRLSMCISFDYERCPRPRPPSHTTITADISLVH